MKASSLTVTRLMMAITTTLGRIYLASAPLSIMFTARTKSLKATVKLTPTSFDKTVVKRWLLIATLSASSRRKMTMPERFASRRRPQKSYATFWALWRNHMLMSCSMRSWRKTPCVTVCTAMRIATALHEVVLSIPGGPCIKTTALAIIFLSSSTAPWKLFIMPDR